MSARQEAFPDPLIDKVAEAIRNDGGGYNEPAWAALPDDRKAGWRGDAERALAVVKDYLTTELSGNSGELEPATCKQSSQVANESLTARARELLAAEYRKRGIGEGLVNDVGIATSIALAAIVSALAARMEPQS